MLNLTISEWISVAKEINTDGYKTCLKSITFY